MLEFVVHFPKRKIHYILASVAGVEQSFRYFHSRDKQRIHSLQCRNGVFTARRYALASAPRFLFRVMLIASDCMYQTKPHIRFDGQYLRAHDNDRSVNRAYARKQTENRDSGYQCRQYSIFGNNTRFRDFRSYERSCVYIRFQPFAAFVLFSETPNIVRLTVSFRTIYIPPLTALYTTDRSF